MQRSSAVGSTLKSRYLGKADFSKIQCEQEYIYLKLEQLLAFKLNLEKKNPKKQMELTNGK